LTLEVTDRNYMWWAALPVLLGMFIVIMDNSVVNVALPRIMGAFGSDVKEIEWVSTGYMLAAAVMMPTTGFLGDRFGRRRLYAGAIALFTLVSLLCGLAWDTASLVAFRILQGAVGGAIPPIGQAILFEAFPPHRRGLSMALVGVGVMLAPTIGPTLGGYLVDFLDWRWIFFVNLPVGMAAATLAWWIVRDNPARRVGFDAVGFAFMAIFLTTLLLAFSHGTGQGWASANIRGLFLAAAISFVAFLAVSLRRTDAIVDLRLYAIPTYTAGTLASVVVGIGLFGSLFLLPLFLQNLMGRDALHTGLLLLPQGLTMALTMPLSGLLLGRLDPRLLLGCGLGAVSLSLFLQAGMTVETPDGEIVAWTVLRSVGFALAFPAMNQTSLGAVPIERIGHASGLYNVTRQIGGTFGIALLATILAHQQSQVPAFQEAFRLAGIIALIGIGPTLFMVPRRRPDPSKD